MAIQAHTLSTHQVARAERAGFWADCINRQFFGLRSDLYGDTEFEGHLSTVQAGDVILTRLQAQRHRVQRSAAQVRASEVGYLKIVAPFGGCAGVEQQGRTAWVQPEQWSLYDTTDAYAVANPVTVEHLIVMLPKERLAERGLALAPLMARRLGGSAGVSRIALATMRAAWNELPGLSEGSARGVGDAITQFVHLSMLELAGRGTALTQSAALLDRIKRHVASRLGDPGLSVNSIALALGCSRRQLYNAFRDEPEGVAGYILAQRVRACRQSFDSRAEDGRTITDIAFGFGFSNMAHFSRVFRAQVGMAPSDYRRRRATLPGAVP